AWMRDIQDWCISRQLWWGHRIPAWYDAEGNIYVGRNEDEVRQKHNLAAELELKQDDDVLDTWFSSALWTFGTHGWPEITERLKTFQPMYVLTRGFYDLFFCDDRMIIIQMPYMNYEAGRPEFELKTVHVTGLSGDEHGYEMPKSRGEVVDTLDMIDCMSLADLF